jgi:hypothetical protein
MSDLDLFETWQAFNIIPDEVDYIKRGPTVGFIYQYNLTLFKLE